MVGMSEQIREIAARIRELREISGIPMADLAKEFGVSVEAYVQYESGDVDIPVSFLYEVAHKFNVELTEILTGGSPRLHTYSLVRAGKGVSMERSKQYQYQNLAYNFIHKKAEPFMVTVEPNGEEKSVSTNTHPGQEFNYVLEGTLQIVVDGHELILNPGDSLFFDSGRPHGMKALNNQTVRFLAIIF